MKEAEKEQQTRDTVVRELFEEEEEHSLLRKGNVRKEEKESFESELYIPQSYTTQFNVHIE